MFDPQTREYKPGMLALVQPKIPPPLEVRFLITSKLLECSEEEFLERLPSWELIPYNFGHLDHNEMIKLFDRIDKLFVRLVSELKTFPENSDCLYDEKRINLESKLTQLLKGANNSLDIVKEVKFFCLFKSLDLMLDIVRYSSKPWNISHAIEILVIYRMIIKMNYNLKRSPAVHKQLGAVFNKSFWYSLNITQFYCAFS